MRLPCDRIRSDDGKRTSYATPQSVKNALGHLAYVLGGVRELTSLRKYRVKTLLDGETVLSGDYLFGAISNSTSVGGILTLDPAVVDMNDGLFELLYVKYPRNLSQLAETIRALTTQDYRSPRLEFRSAKQVRIHAAPTMDWTLDGEFARGASELAIENLHSAVQIMMKD